MIKKGNAVGFVAGITFIALLLIAYCLLLIAFVLSFFSLIVFFYLLLGFLPGNLRASTSGAATE